MLPILVPSSAKHLAIQILVIAKSNGRKYFDRLCLRYHPSQQGITCSTEARIRCENCSRLRMKTLQRCYWRHPSVFIVNCNHISSFILIVEFEQANFWWGHINLIKHSRIFQKRLTARFWDFLTFRYLLPGAILSKFQIRISIFAETRAILSRLVGEILFRYENTTFFYHI